MGLRAWGVGATLSHCVAMDNGFSGVNANVATIRDCVSEYNGGDGFQIGRVVLTNCVAANNALHGIEATASWIEGCLVYQNTQMGINVIQSDVIANKVMQNGGTGIEVTGLGSLVARNELQANAHAGIGYGINVTGSVSRIEHNHVSSLGATPSHDVGIRVVGDENVVINNSAHDNVVNYDLSGAGGSYGPLQNAASATSPFANIEY